MTGAGFSNLDRRNVVDRMPRRSSNLIEPASGCGGESDYPGSIQRRKTNVKTGERRRHTAKQSERLDPSVSGSTPPAAPLGQESS